MGSWKGPSAFGTAVVVAPDGHKIDVATARRETYKHPAALPTVEPSSIRDDLLRRDFSINTLAFALNGPEAFRLDRLVWRRRRPHRRVSSACCTIVAFVMIRRAYFGPFVWSSASASSYINIRCACWGVLLRSVGWSCCQGHGSGGNSA